MNLPRNVSARIMLSLSLMGCVQLLEGVSCSTHLLRGLKFPFRDGNGGTGMCVPFVKKLWKLILFIGGDKVSSSPLHFVKSVIVPKSLAWAVRIKK